jgi:hypothetical protein
VLADYSKSSERTVFWDDDLGVNVDPFKGLDGGFFAADWDTKVRLLVAPSSSFSDHIVVCS